MLACDPTLEDETHLVDAFVLVKKVLSGDVLAGTASGRRPAVPVMDRKMPSTTAYAHCSVLRRSLGARRLALVAPQLGQHALERVLERDIDQLGPDQTPDLDRDCFYDGRARAKGSLAPAPRDEVEREEWCTEGPVSSCGALEGPDLHDDAVEDGGAR